MKKRHLVSRKVCAALLAVSMVFNSAAGTGGALLPAFAAESGEALSEVESGQNGSADAGQSVSAESGQSGSSDSGQGAAADRSQSGSADSGQSASADNGANAPTGGSQSTPTDSGQGAASSGGVDPNAKANAGEGQADTSAGSQGAAANDAQSAAPGETTSASESGAAAGSGAISGSASENAANGDGTATAGSGGGGAASVRGTDDITAAATGSTNAGTADPDETSAARTGAEATAGSESAGNETTVGADPVSGAEGESASEAEEETGAETSMEPGEEAGSEAEPETETESETEDETESESESEEDEPHSILFAVEEGAAFALPQDRVTYQAGEAVSFDVKVEADHRLTAVTAVTVEEAAAGSGELSGGMISAGEAQALLLLEGESVALTQTALPTFDGAEEDSASYTFIMPDEDVMLMAATEKAAASTTKVELDNGSLKMIPKAWTPSGHTWYQDNSTIGCSVYRTVTMPDGKKRIAYCLQPTIAAAGDGTYTATEISGAKGKMSAAEAELLRKALFYCYGGPGWGSDDIKDILSDCETNDEYYVASHFILAKIYCEAVGGTWDKVVFNDTQYDAVNNRGLNQINKAVSAIEKLPDPSAALSTSQVSGSYDAASGFAITQAVTYSSNVSGNNLTTTLPDGVYLAVGSKEYAPGKKATIQPGESFVLKKKDYQAASSQTLTFTASIMTDFEAYLINVAADRQNMGFSYVAGKELSLRVNWPDLLTSLGVVKQDALTGSQTPSAGYSMDGAVYGVYADAAKTKLLESVTIANGAARTGDNYVIGQTYYIAEISASADYLIDPNVYTVVAAADGQAQVVSKDEPRTLAIRVKKTDAQTGEARPQTDALTFAGARFAVYKDEACQERATDMNGDALPDLVTDENGEAATAASLLAGDYWVREISAPEGYLLSDQVSHISTAQAKDAAVSQTPEIALSFAEQIIRGNVELMKIRNEKDQSISPAAGVRFRFTYTADPTVTFTVSEAGENLIVTDEEGFATTVSPDYPLGTLIYGEWLITEENTPEGYDPITPMTVMVSSHGRTYRFTANDRHIFASILIEKRDAQTGELIPVAGVSFSILKDGKPVEQFDSVTRKYQTAWTTGADGMVQLPEALDYGTYTLAEDPATLPDGYLVMENKSFTVSARTQDAAHPLVLTASEPPQMGRIQVKKQDAGTGEALPGFTFLVTAADDIVDAAGHVRTGRNADGQEGALVSGTKIAVLTTGDDGTAVSEDLYLGSYTVQEVKGADGYAILADAQTVTLAADREAAKAGNGAKAEVLFENHPTTLEIVKTVQGTGEALAGVTFSVMAAEESGAAAGGEASGQTPTGAESGQDAGNGESSQNAGSGESGSTTGEGISTQAGGSYVTDENGRIVIGKLRAGSTYTVRETATVPGYNLDTHVETFTVDENGLIDGSWRKELSFTNVPNVLTISKQEITGGAEIPGATLVIRDSVGETVAEWVSTDKPHVITAIPAGEYTLTESIPAPGYVTAETIRFTVTDQTVAQCVTMKDDCTKVRISKKDITDGKPVIGALLIISDSDGKEVARWTTTKEPYYIEKLPIGDYTLTEITAPKGYKKAESVDFTVQDHGAIQKVVMYDEPEEKAPRTDKPASPGSPSAPSSPKTGDTTQLLPYVLALAASLLTLLVLLALLLKNRKRWVYSDRRK